MSAVLLIFPNISLKTLFFFLFSLYLLINTNVSAHHVHSGCDCTLLELMDLPVRNIQPNTLFSVTQTSCQRYFKFTVDEATMEKQFLILEVIYEEVPSDWSFSPILVEKNGERPIVLMTKHIPLTQNIDTMDYNAYTARKLYHHITLSTQEVSLNDTLYFGVYFVFDSLAVDTNFSLPYTLQLRTTETYPCPGNCSGNGICNEELQQCTCETGYFDEDCSVKATELTPETLVTMKIAGMGRGLYYMKMNNRSRKGMTLDIFKQAGPAKISLSFNDPDDYSLPTGRCDADSYSFESTNTQTSFSLDQDSCENRNNQILLIEPFNLLSQDITLHARVDLFEDEQQHQHTNLLPLFIVLGVLTAFFAFWGTISIIKARNLRLRHARVHGLEGASAEPLSQEEIQKYYPEARYNSFNVSFIQTTCSICIEEFEGPVVCRKLHCDHIFHKKCIDSWLSTRSSCPNCKKEMSKECLEKIYQNKKNSQQQKLGNSDDDNLKIEVLDSLERPELPLPPSLCTALSEGPAPAETQLSDRFGSNLLSESSNDLRDLNIINTLRRVSSRQTMIQSRNINISPRSDTSHL